MKEFGNRNIHIELVTNGDKLKPNLIKNLIKSGLKQFVVSMYDGPEQIEFFKDLFKECGISDKYFTLRDRWYEKKKAMDYCTPIGLGLWEIKLNRLMIDLVFIHTTQLTLIIMEMYYYAARTCIIEQKYLEMF